MGIGERKSGAGTSEVGTNDRKRKFALVLATGTLRHDVPRSRGRRITRARRRAAGRLVAVSGASFPSSAVHDVPGRLLFEADALHGPVQVLRTGRLLLQADAVRRSVQILRAERLLQQAAAGDPAALPHASLHLRTSADVRLRAFERRSKTANRGPRDHIRSVIAGRSLVGYLLNRGAAHRELRRLANDRPCGRTSARAGDVGRLARGLRAG